MSVLFKNLTAGALHAELATSGVSLRLARRLQAVVLREDAIPDELPEVSTRLLQHLRTTTQVPKLELRNRSESPRDGFVKYVFAGGGGDQMEAVRIPLLHRTENPKYVVCVSSQIGCAMGCVFCATGRQGLQRNLAAWEIVDQVLQIRRESPHPVRGVVFRGMGEPLQNYDAVITAAQILSEPCGAAIAAKAITLSTSGIVPAIRRFTAERHPYRLIISLTSADPHKRAQLMPVERSNPTDELLSALRDYHAATGQRITLAWTLMQGINTSEEDARQLAALTRGLPVQIDLIDVNDPTGRFSPPTPAELTGFRDALRRHVGAPVARRYSGGSDIHAACGMLATALHPQQQS